MLLKRKRTSRAGLCLFQFEKRRGRQGVYSTIWCHGRSPGRGWGTGTPGDGDKSRWGLTPSLTPITSLLSQNISRVSGPGDQGPPVSRRFSPNHLLKAANAVRTLAGLLAQLALGFIGKGSWHRDSQENRPDSVETPVKALMGKCHGLCPLTKTSHEARMKLTCWVEVSVGCSCPWGSPLSAFVSVKSLIIKTFLLGKVSGHLALPMRQG